MKLLLMLVLFYFMEEANCQGNLNIQFPVGTDCDAVKNALAGLGIIFRDLNECTIADSCPEYSTCENVECSFNCNCTDGFTELRNASFHDRLFKCMDINECNVTETGKANPCENFALTTCANTVGNYTCDCINGYEKDASGSCVDIDECNSMNGMLHNCTVNKKCNNIEGGFTCVCADGFRTLANGSCENINECEIFNTAKNEIYVILNSAIQSEIDTARMWLKGFIDEYSDVVSGANFKGQYPKVTDGDVLNAVKKLPCDFIATCADNEGSYTCSCPDGFTIDTNSINECADVDECVDFDTAVMSINDVFFRDSTNEEKAAAFSFLASYQLPSYANPADATALRSQIINDFGITAIDNLICNFYATCSNTLGSVSCTCKDGFIGDGKMCYDLNECPAFNAAKSNIFVLLDESSSAMEQESARTALQNYVPGYIAKNPALNAAFHLRYMLSAVDANIRSVIGLLACDLFSTCSNEFSTFACTCEGPSYVFNTSRSCKDFNECTDPVTHPCRNNSMCENSEGSFECPCVDGYEPATSGDSCEDVDECATGGVNRCHAQASCQNTIGSHNCFCNSGFSGTGEDCTDINECADEGVENRCDVNAMCENTIGNHTCTCNSGYIGTGEICDNIDECLENSTCDILADCTDTEGSFICTCNKGYEGDGTSGNCINVDECETETDNCHDSATCTDTDGGFDCSCKLGFTGNGINCSDINECAHGADNRCDSSASCSNTVGNYTCTCNPGFSGPGEFCDDIDECLDNSSCDALARCNNTEGSFFCICEAGYTGTGLPAKCMNVDECTLGSDFHDCHDNATCCDVPGGFTCKCNSQFFGTGKECRDSRSCASLSLLRNAIDVVHGGKDSTDMTLLEAKTLLEHYAEAKGINFTVSGDSFRAINNIKNDSVLSIYILNVLDKLPCDYVTESCDGIIGGSLECTCPAGYMETTPNECKDIDECAPENMDLCDTNAHCDNTIGNHICTCNTGFTGDGETCDDINECAPEAVNRCDPVAACTNTVGNYTCTCNPGYSGTGYSCEDIDECAPENMNLCDTNAQCDNTIGNYTCTCNTGFTGDGQTCDDINECDTGGDNRCDPDATCANTVGNHTCTCNPGYFGSGEMCDDIDECSNCSVCDASAQCSNTKGSFYCICDAGYTGDGKPGNCSDIDVCANGDNDCHANATCTDTFQGFNCTCKTGFFGDGKVLCKAGPSVLFPEDMEPEDCSTHLHPLSCAFRKQQPDLALATFSSHISSFFPPPAFNPATTRNETDFTAPSPTSNRLLCGSSAKYASPADVPLEPDLSMRKEVFSYGAHRQWFTEISCLGESTCSAALRLSCESVYSSQKGVIITEVSTGEYAVSLETIFLSSSCQPQFCA